MVSCTLERSCRKLEDASRGGSAQGAAYERSSIASRYYPCHYHRSAASRKTIVQRDIENRHCASLFDICCLYIFHRDERAGCRFVSPRAGARVRNHYFDLHRDWKYNPQKKRKKVNRGRGSSRGNRMAYDWKWLVPIIIAIVVIAVSLITIFLVVLR